VLAFVWPGLTLGALVLLFGAYAPMVPFEIAGGPEELVKVRVSGKEYTPPEISALIIRKLREAAERHLGHKVRLGDTDTAALRSAIGEARPGR
jgi:molecular chaperone DnaK (HSP70)